MKAKKSCILFFILFLMVLLIYLFDKKLVFDEFVYENIISIRGNFIDKYFITVTKLGNPITILFLLLLFVLFFRNKFGITLVISCMTSLVSNSLIKNVFKRVRPAHVSLIKQGGYSFPSGHAMISICFYGYLLYLVIKKVKNKYLKYILSLFLIVIILSIGISRIYVGVHYPTDVLAGYFLATCELIIVVNRCRRWFGE